MKILNLRENPGILTCGSSVREICQNCKVEELDFGACNFRGDVLAALPRILRDVEVIYVCTTSIDYFSFSQIF